MVHNFNNNGQSGDFTPVTKDSPCPHCGKPDWCYSIGKLSVCKRPQFPPAAGWEATSKADKDGDVYYAPIQEKKAIRPRGTRYWVYNDRNGSPLIRVVRFDDGKGGKNGKGDANWTQQSWGKCKNTREMGWIGGIQGIERENIPIYRYAEVRKAIANNELIFIAEGEDNVDRLWALGFAATCNIGGSGKWRESDTKDLQGAKVVIVPDRDEPGIKHAELLHQPFPDALFLYPFPNSKAWENLPKSKGLDIADWIEQHNITADDIRAAIGEKKIFNPEQPSSNLVIHPRFTPPDSEELTEKFAEIYNLGLTGHKLTEALRPLGVNPQQTRRDYEEYVTESERIDQRLERKADIESLLRIDKNRLNLEEYLPSYLANPIKQVASWMGVDAEAILTFLLPITASLLNPKSCIVAKECTNFKQPFVLYTGTVGLTGDRKTPALDVVKNPLGQLQVEEDTKNGQALQRYEAEMQAFQNTKPKERNNEELPQKPKPPREFFVDNATVEALDKIKGQQPEHGLVSIKDELSGLFASHGAYKGGKGADKESYLSGWNGGGVKKNRAGDGSRVSLPRDSLSITGGIQPDKICSLLGDFNDSQGEWARFLWYHMPTRPYKIPRDDTSYSLDGLLLDTYRKIDALPILKLRFDKQGQTHFDDWYDAKDEQKCAEIKPGLRAAIAKMPGQAVRLIGILHVLNNVSEGGELPSEIALATVQAGCRLADFYLGQVTLLQSKGDTLNGELTPVLKEIVSKVYDGRASLTARDVIASKREVRGKTASQIRELFVELAAMGLVDTQGQGNRLALVPKTADKSQNAQNSCSIKDVENISSKLLTTADKVLTTPKQVENQLEQGLQEMNCKSADSADAFDTTKPKKNCLKVELDNVTDTSTADKNGSFKESVSTSALYAENSIQQGDKGADSQSAPCQQPSAIQPEPVDDAVTKLKFATTWTAVYEIMGGPDKTELREQLKQALPPDERKRIGALHAGAIKSKGTRCRYIGQERAEHLAGLDLIVVAADRCKSLAITEITCSKPDGSYTTRLKPSELNAFEA